MYKILRIIRKITRLFNLSESAFGRNWKIFPNKDYASDLIYKELMADKPSMIARIGSTEMLCMINYLGVKNPEKYKSIRGYINWQTPPWWWESATIQQMQDWSGFFPGSVDKIEKFCALMLEDMPKTDILGSWLKDEKFFLNELAGVKKVMLEDLEPFFTSVPPWTRALANKKVLVVHPFAETIEYQYKKREHLFENNLLPEFELKTIKAVQSIAGEETPFKDWFEALEHMKAQIAATDYDICILGCGAYGFPLASFVKQSGKKAIHLGGITQILFGIKGKRWENYIVYPYTNLYNEYWVRPGETDKPKNANMVEGACYW